MATRSQLAATVIACSFGAFLAVVACGSDDENNSSSGGSSGTSGGSSGFSGASSSGEDGPPPCVGLQCKQVSCSGGGTTSLSGKVYLPEGTIPLYNAIVYVPNSALAPFPSGISCDKCGTAPSGNPITTALSDATGSFTLKNVPVGVDFPLVIQLGRWRRQITVPAAKVTQCGDAKLDAADTRLPKDKSEGDIPQIAITTGGADSLECFLRKIGIADSEFTPGNGAGRVHLYQGSTTDTVDPAATMAGATNAQSLWDSEAELKKHDIVILSCEGDEINQTKSQLARDNIKKYLDGGGRVFASHYHYTWFKNNAGAGTNPLSVTASWLNGDDSVPADQNVTIDQTVQKGKDFATWMDTVQATTAVGSGQVAMTELKSSVMSVPGAGQPPETSRRWLYATQENDRTKFFSFNTPLGTPPDMQCGRAVHTDVHVSAGDESKGTFPINCKTTVITPQEKALIFILMDLAACIQDDSKAPVPPPADPGVK
jgi:hypothetical protein